MLAPFSQKELPKWVHAPQLAVQSVPVSQNVVKADEPPYVLIASLAHDSAHPEDAFVLVTLSQAPPKLARGNRRVPQEVRPGLVVGHVKGKLHDSDGVAIGPGRQVASDRPSWRGTGREPESARPWRRA